MCALVGALTQRLQLTNLGGDRPLEIVARHVQDHYMPREIKNVRQLLR